MTIDKDVTLIPKGYKNKDPRSLLYYFPSMPKVKLAKLMNKFYFYKALEAVEIAAKKNGFILIPAKCIHWERKQQYAQDRNVQVVGKSFYMMKIEELTKTEKRKLTDYIYEEVENLAS